MIALVLPLLLAADDAAYALGKAEPAALVAPGRLFTLADLRYRASQENGTTQLFSARLRVADLGYVAAFVDDQKKGGGLETQRLALDFFQDPSFTNLHAGWRGSRFIVDVSGEQRPPQDGRGWALDGELSVRLSPDVEVFAAAHSDTHPGRVAPARELRAQRLATLWQHGTRLDLSAAVFHDESTTEAGFELDSTGASASAAGFAWNSEGDAEIGYRRTTGQLRSDEIFANGSLRSVWRRRILVEAVSNNRWEPGVLWFEHDLGFGLSLHGRRIRLPRSGESAQRTLDLSRRAIALGHDERRVYDDESRRAMRERLSLSKRRAEMSEDLLALHRAQIEERQVPLFGASFSEHVESVTGIRRRSYAGFVGMPWPPRWPWQADEAVSPFLKASYVRDDTRYANDFTSRSHAAVLEAELRRDMTLAVRWRRPGVTPLDVAFSSGRSDRWEVEYAYALGR